VRSSEVSSLELEGDLKSNPKALHSLKNSSGFSLLLVVVLTGVFSTIGLIISQLSQSTNKALNASNDWVNFNQLVSVVQLVISSPADCPNAFSTATYDPMATQNTIPSIRLNDSSGLPQVIFQTGKHYSGLSIDKIYFNNSNKNYFTGATGPATIDDAGTLGPANPFLPQKIARINGGPLSPYPTDVSGIYLPSSWPAAQPNTRYSYVTFLHIEAKRSATSFGQNLLLVADLPIRVTTEATATGTTTTGPRPVIDCLGIPFTSTLHLLSPPLPAGAPPPPPPTVAPPPAPFPWVTASICKNMDSLGKQHAPKGLTDRSMSSIQSEFFIATGDPSNPDWSFQDLVGPYGAAYQFICPYYLPP